MLSQRCCLCTRQLLLEHAQSTFSSTAAAAPSTSALRTVVGSSRRTSSSTRTTTASVVPARPSGRRLLSQAARSQQSHAATFDCAIDLDAAAAAGQEELPGIYWKGKGRATDIRAAVPSTRHASRPSDDFPTIADPRRTTRLQARLRAPVPRQDALADSSDQDRHAAPTASTSSTVSPLVPDKRLPATQHEFEARLSRGRPLDALLILTQMYLDSCADQPPDLIVALDSNISRILDHSPTSSPSSSTTTVPETSLQQLQSRLSAGSVDATDVVERLLCCILDTALTNNMYAKRKRDVQELLKQSCQVLAASGTITPERFSGLVASMADTALELRRWHTALALIQHAIELLGVVWTQRLLSAHVRAASAAQEFDRLPPFSSIRHLDLHQPGPALLQGYMAAGSTSQAQQLLRRLWGSNRRTATGPDGAAHSASSSFEHLFEALIGACSSAGLSDAQATRTLLRFYLPCADLSAIEFVNALIACHVRTGQMDRAQAVFQVIRDEMALYSSRNHDSTTLPSSTPQSQADDLPLDGNEASPAYDKETPADPLSIPTSAPVTLAESILPDGISPLRPNVQTFTSFVEGYTAMGSLDKALDFYTQMVDDGLSPSPFLTEALREAFRISGRASVRLPRLPDQIQHGVGPRDTQIDSDAVPDGSFGVASQTLIDEEYLPSIVLAQTAHPEDLIVDETRERLQATSLVDAIQAIRELTLDGIRLAEETVGDLVVRLKRCKQVPAARLADFLEELRCKGGLEPSIFQLNLLLDEFDRRDALPKLHKSVRQVRGAAQPDSTPTLALSFNSHSDGDLASFYSLAKELQGQGVTPDSRTVSYLMHRFARMGGSPNKLWEYFRWQLLDRGLQPQHQHISALMIAAVNSGDAYGARRAMERGEALGVEINVRHYTILIDHLLSRGQGDAAESIFNEMQSRGIDPDLPLYGTLAHWAARQGQAERVQDIIDTVSVRLPEVDQPDTVLQTSLFYALNTRGDTLAAQTSLQFALQRGLRPDRQLVRVVRRSVRNLQVSLNREAKKRLADSHGREEDENSNNNGRNSRHSASSDENAPPPAPSSPSDTSARDDDDVRRVLLLARENYEVASRRLLEMGNPYSSLTSRESEMDVLPKSQDVTNLLEVILENRQKLTPPPPPPPDVATGAAQLGTESQGLHATQ